MKKSISFLFCLTLLFTIQLITNCSQPLDAVSDDGQFIIDTLYLIDTTEVTDTNTFIDTIRYVDTVIIIDTLSFIDTMSFADTIIIVEAMYCDRLKWYNRQIDWSLENQQGLYSFEFTASTEENQDLPVLLIDIDGQQYYWHLTDGLDLDLEQNIDSEASVNISYTYLQSCYVTIEVCFRVNEL